MLRETVADATTVDESVHIRWRAVSDLFGVIGALANSPAAARALKRAISDRRMYWRPQMLTVVSIFILR